MKPNDPKPADYFEQHLAHVSRRAAPAGWRSEILSAAKSAAPSALSSPRSPLTAHRSPRPQASSFPGQFLAWLGGLSPAWRTLAAVWIVCLTINHFTWPTPSGSSANHFATGRLAPEQIAAARAQRREMLQLAGLMDPEPAEPPPSRTPRPRSSLAVPAYG